MSHAICYRYGAAVIPVVVGSFPVVSAAEVENSVVAAVLAHQHKACRREYETKQCSNGCNNISCGCQCLLEEDRIPAYYYYYYY